MSAQENLQSDQFRKLTDWGKENNVSVGHSHDGTQHTVTIKNGTRKVTGTHQNLDYATSSAVRAYNRRQGRQ